MSKLPTLEQANYELARRHVLDFIPWATSKWKSPHHLSTLLTRFELAVQALKSSGVIPNKDPPKGVAPQFVVCHAPPRHGKTEALIHAIAWTLWLHPEVCFSYTTYGDRRSRRAMRALRQLLDRINVKLVTRNLNDLRTPEGGGVVAGGIKGPLVGEGIHIAVIDDPIKSQVEAQSQIDRATKEDWFDTGLLTRLEPGGSVFCFMHRWHPDDLAGYLLKKHKFEYLCYPAIDAHGKALWPERWPVSSFDSKKKVAHVWAALYQGQPRPRGDNVFDGCHTYSVLPRVYRSGFGLDLSYSGKTKSHFSIALRLLREERGKEKPRYYVVHVERRQEKAPRFRARCAQLHKRDPTARWRWYTSTTEEGVANLFDTDDGAPIEAELAKGDKLIRANPAAEAWNDGRIFVPENASWLEDFLTVVNGFTGVNDACDDDVDALAAAFDLLEEGGSDDEFEDPPPADEVRMGLGALRA